MATVTDRWPDRAGWSSPLGSIVVIRDQRQLVVGTRRVSPEDAIEYRDALTAALHWLGALDDDLDDDGAVPEPCRTSNARGIPCRLDEGHGGPHQFYAHPSDDPWTPAECGVHLIGCCTRPRGHAGEHLVAVPTIPADQVWGGED